MIKALVLDISKRELVPTQTIVLRQGDRHSTTLNIAIMEEGSPFNLSGYTARFMAQLKNKEIIIDPCEIIGANSLSYVLPSQIATFTGTVALAYIAIYKDDDWVASTDTITFIVREGIDVSADKAAEWISEFETLRKNFETLLGESIAQQKTQQEEWEEQMASQDADYQKAETTRSANEEARITAEETRAASENARASAETVRKNAEAARASAENARASAENERAEAEAERVSAENIRVSQENARISREGARAAAEDSRVSAEKARVAAESKRADAEADRVAAEAKREEDVAEAIKNIQSHTAITDDEIDEIWQAMT